MKKKIGKKMRRIKREDKRALSKQAHYGSGKSFSLIVNSKVLPFVVEKKNPENFDESLQEFVSLLEKSFGAIWYIGSELIGDELYERFMFHSGGFMEISLDGELRCFFFEDERKKFKKALFKTIEKMSSKSSATHVLRHAKVGQRLVSLRDSLS